MGVPFTLHSLLCSHATLAQAGSSATSGLVEYYVLEHPILGMLAVLLVGIVAAEAVRRSGRGKAALWTLAAAACVGAAVVFIGHRVETPRERVTAATKTFVAAVIAAKPGDAEPLLAQRINFRTDGRPNATLDRDWLMGVIRGLGSAFKSHSLEVQDVTLTNDASSAQVRFLSRAEFSSGSGGGVGGWGLIPSTWELSWRKDTTSGGDGAWRITAVECVTIYGKPATGEWVNWGNRHRK